MTSSTPSIPHRPGQNPQPRPSPTCRKAALILIIIFAFGLRLIRLGADSLWYDETVSVFLAGQRAGELIGHTARDIHPPGYYLLLRGWLLLTGYPTGRADPNGHGLEFMAAFLSLWFGVLLVPLSWRLARSLRLPEPAPLLAALLIAISPFGIWYSQEVRMYTLGASLGLLCLLATAQFLCRQLAQSRLWPAALLYMAGAAAGLYALYYFAFLLVAINLIVLPVLICGMRRSGRSLDRARSTIIRTERKRLGIWLVAQVGTLLLYLPWLPIAWRQATDPPVPPWRTPPRLGTALVESWTALNLGQSADASRLWPVLVLTLMLVSIGVTPAFLGVGERGKGARDKPLTPYPLSPIPYPLSLALLLAAAFGPLLLILMASVITPLYHVRYLFTYSPAFSVLVALGLAALWRWHQKLGRWLGTSALIVLLVGSGLSLRRFWSDPQFSADDYKTAVAELAQRWRPGDAILVNAGYAYTALLTYWPLPVAWHGRLSDLGPEQLRLLADSNGAVILQTGHVGGDPDLGWGDPRSDFYALPTEVLRERLGLLADATPRLWHYRIYDTVNDPQGVIREELKRNWTLFDDRVYAGEANMRVQGYLSRRWQSSGTPVAEFDNWLELRVTRPQSPVEVQAGQALNLRRVSWSRKPGTAGQPASLSLRLVDDRGEIWAQHDEPIGGNVADLHRLDRLPQPLHLDIPAGTAPLDYRLMLVVYNPQTGQPLSITSGAFAGRDAVELAAVAVQRPTPLAAPLPAAADFGPLRLVRASTPATVVSPGDVIPLSLLWQAAPDFAGEPLVVVVQLLDDNGQVVASLEEQPLASRYPTSAWQSGELVRDRHWLDVPIGTAPGRYRLIVGLYRAEDRQRLETVRGPLRLGKSDHVLIRKIQVR